MDINSITLTGRFVRDPELRKTSNGNSVAEFSIAVNGASKNVSYVPVEAWGVSAGNIVKYCHKGSQVAVSGRLDQHSFKSKDGTSHSIIKVVANQVEFLDLGNKIEDTKENAAEEFGKEFDKLYGKIK